MTQQPRLHSVTHLPKVERTIREDGTVVWMASASGVVYGSTPWFSDCMEAAYQHGQQSAQTEIQHLRAALQAITEPADSDSEYGLLYLWNIIEWCRKTARDALNLVHDDDSEGVRA